MPELDSSQRKPDTQCCPKPNQQSYSYIGHVQILWGSSSGGSYDIEDGYDEITALGAHLGEAYGPAADVWAFGCVVFEMLELGLPYGEADGLQGSCGSASSVVFGMFSAFAPSIFLVASTMILSVLVIVLPPSDPFLLALVSGGLLVDEETELYVLSQPQDLTLPQLEAAEASASALL